ncbi:hypothetical protein FACS189443_5430 [Planctomycetales bacterium]|nr:hypothetical protein FACS189443_5430 [Planctomycetales bacterium]
MQTWFSRLVCKGIRFSKTEQMHKIVVGLIINESESITQLYLEMSEVAAANEYDAEIIFVDDGSSDDSWNVIRQIAEKDERIQAIRFRRNFGKAAALSAGFGIASGEIVLTMDADLQDDPQEIPGFVEKIEAGFDVVSGWKKIRHDPWHKVFPSRCFNAMVSYLTGVKLHDHNCGMKCYRKEVVHELDVYGERHRFLPVLAAAKGYRVGEKIIAHRARQFGHSKYGFTRFAKGFLDLLTVWFQTKYGWRPMHFFGTIGLVMILIGLAGWLGGEIIVHFAQGALLNGGILPIVVGVICAITPRCLFFGGTLLALGLVSELFVANGKPVEKQYSVQERVGNH